jgi:hypothetical protein
MQECSLSSISIQKFLSRKNFLPQNIYKMPSRNLSFDIKFFIKNIILISEIEKNQKISETRISGLRTFTPVTFNSLKRMITVIASPRIPGYSYLRFFNKDLIDTAILLGESLCAFNVSSYAVQNLDIINNTMVKITIMENTRLIKVEEDEIPEEPSHWDGNIDESQEEYNERVRLYKEEMNKFQYVTDIIYFLGRNEYIHEYKFV